MGMMASQGLWSKPGRDPRQLLQTLLDSCHCSHLSEGLHHPSHPHKDWYRQPQRLHTYNPHVCSYEVFRAAVSHIRDCIPPPLILTSFLTIHIGPRRISPPSPFTECLAIWRTGRAPLGCSSWRIPDILTTKLDHHQVHPDTCSWIKDFPTN